MNQVNSKAKYVFPEEGYLAGPTTYSLPIGEEHNCNFDFFLPFNSKGVDITFNMREHTSADFELTMDGTWQYNGQITADNNTAAISFDIMKRMGEHTLTITTSVPAKPASITFHKENIKVAPHVEEYYRTIELDPVETATQTAIIICEDAAVIKVNGARRYVKPSDATHTPIKLNREIYLPIKTGALALGYYIEEKPHDTSGYILLRNKNVEFFYKDGISYKRVKEGTPEITDNPIKYINTTAYMPICHFAELAGKTVGHRNGITIIDRRHFVREILENDEIFKAIETEFENYKPLKSTMLHSNKTYHVAQTPTASDNNDGSEATPFRTLAKASTTARAGDTVIIHSGVYRETLTPKNDGTPTDPIIFRGAKGEKVVISACEEVTGFTWEKLPNGKGALVAPVKTDLGRGKNQLFYKGEVIAQARYPSHDTVKRDLPVKLGPLWFTAGNIQVGDGQGNYTATSADELNQPPGYWDKGLFVGMHHNGWCLATAFMEKSEPGKLHFDEERATKIWWDWKPREYTYVGFITEHINCLSEPGSWHIQDGKLYIIPPAGETAESLKVEIKQRQLIADLDDRKYVQMIGLKAIGGSIKMKYTDMCMVKDCCFRYISHYTFTYDQREAFNDNPDISARENNADGQPPNGESGIYVGGRDNAFINNIIDHSAGAGLYIVGRYLYAENNEIFNCSYSGGSVANIYISFPRWFANHSSLPKGGHSFYFNTLYNCGRAAYQINNNAPAYAFLPSEIAYNEFYNTTFLSRDSGAYYTYRTVLGNEVLKERVYNNLIRDALHNGLLPEGAISQTVYTNGFYYDDWTQHSDCYDNLLYYTHVNAPFGNPLAIQNSGPRIFATIDMWNNSTLGHRPGGKESLRQIDYPSAKVFHAGVVRPDTVFWNYENLGKNINNYCPHNVSTGMQLIGGTATFSDGGQWAEYKDVDFGDGKNIITLYYMGDKYNPGDKIALIIGDSIETGRVYNQAILPIASAYLDGQNRIELPIKKVSGVTNVYIKCLEYHGLSVCRIALDIADSMLVKLPAIDGTVLQGNVRRANDWGVDGIITPVLTGIDAETILQFSNVYIREDATKLCCRAMSPTDGDDGGVLVMNLHNGSADGAVIGTVEVTTTGQFEYKWFGSSLIKPLVKGEYDLCLTFAQEGNQRTNTLFWIGFEAKEILQ